jgi:SAM-dependent methyltransferase
MSELRDVVVAGRRLRLHAPGKDEIVDAVGGRVNGPGDAELHTWAVPWESGLFLQMARWDLSGLDILDLGCGLGLAGCFALLHGAGSVFFADRSEVAVGLALRSAADNAPPGSTIRGEHGSWSQTASWPEVDLILANEVLYVADACQELTALLLSRVLRPGGVAAFCGCDRGLWEPFQQHLAAAGLEVRCGNGFAAAVDSAGSLQPTVLLLVVKPSASGAPSPPAALQSIQIRPDVWQDTGASRAKLAPPPCIAPPPPPPPLLTSE